MSFSKSSGVIMERTFGGQYVITKSFETRLQITKDYWRCYKGRWGGRERGGEGEKLKMSEGESRVMFQFKN